MRLAVVEVEPRRGWSAQLEPGAVIGRQRDCDLRLADPLASRRHARVWQCGEATAIEDLGSHNGLYVNERRCEDIVQLRLGDRVRLGATLWIVVPSVDEAERACANGVPVADESPVGIPPVDAQG